MDTLVQLVNIVTGLLTLVGGVLAVLWAYTKYVLERGFLPPVEFYVTAKKLGVLNGNIALDIKIHLHNIGSATLVAQNIRLDLRYMGSKDQPPKLLPDPRRAGRLQFPQSLTKDENIDPGTLIPIKIRTNEERLDQWRCRQLNRRDRGFLILEYDTFVQPQVDQAYTFVTKVPEDTICFLTWCSFEYAQHPSKWQQKIYAISRKFGLIQYTLDHVKERHTVEDVFWLGDKAGTEQSEPL